MGRPAVSDARNRQGLLPDGALLIARPARAFTWHGTVYVRVSGQVMPVLPCEALSELLAALEQYRDPFFLLTIQVTTYRERNFALIRRADRLGAESVAAGLSADVMTLMTETETALGLAAVSGEPGAGRQQGPLLAIPIDDPEQAAFGAETLDSLRTSNIRAPLIRLTDRLRQAQRLGVSPQSLDAAELAKRPRPPGPGGSPSQTTSPPSGEPTIATKAGAGPGRIGPNVWYGESSAGDRTPRGVATVRQRESLDSQMAVPDVGGHGASDAASPADFLTNDPTRAKLIRGVREVPVRPDLDASETGTASQLAAATLPPRRRSANEMLGLNAPAGVGRGELDSQPRDEGALVLARSGRLVHTSDGALFYFDDQQPPIVVLPSAGLTTADVLSNYGRQRVKLRISGELTRHNQRNYLVLSRVIREPYDISERR